MLILNAIIIYVILIIISTLFMYKEKYINYTNAFPNLGFIQFNQNIRPWVPVKVKPPKNYFPKTQHELYDPINVDSIINGNQKMDFYNAMFPNVDHIQWEQMRNNYIDKVLRRHRIKQKDLNIENQKVCVNIDSNTGGEFYDKYIIPAITKYTCEHPFEHGYGQGDKHHINKRYVGRWVNVKDII